MKILICHHLSLWNLDLSSWKSRPFIRKTWTDHHKKLYRSSWKSRPFNMKISTVHHENLDRSSEKSRPFIGKISTVQHKNLNRSSWKPWPFIMKLRLFIMKISTVQHENLDRSTWNLNFWLKWHSILFFCFMISLMLSMWKSNKDRHQYIVNSIFWCYG